MPTIPIKWLTDSNANKRYPVTHTKAVFNDDGDDLDTILDGLGGSLAGLSDTTITNPTSGQVLSYNGSSWVNANSGGGGLSDYDFTHTSNATVSTSVTVTFAADTRGSRMVSTSADLGVFFAVNNSSDNYLWVRNTGSSEIDITINSVTHNSSSVSNVYMPSDGISVPAGNVCEIGIVCNADGAFVTSRNDLAL